jgi:hypothetical protein
MDDITHDQVADALSVIKNRDHMSRERDQ